MIDFDIAKTWHRIFSEQLEFVAAGLIPVPPLERVCDDSACKLGQWLRGAGKCMESTPAYAELMTLHARFHKVACDYLNITLGESDEQSKKQIEAELRKASTDVVAAIDGLRDVVDADRNTSAYSSQYGTTATTDSFSWDPSLAIGIPAIDSHHQAIVGILNKLMKNPDAALHSESAVDSLTDLTKILDLHFSVEEAYMKRLGMPEQELAEHQERHTEILEQCSQLNVASFTNRDLKVRDIASQVRRWAIDHVIERDFNIKKYLHASTDQSSNGTA